MSETPTPTDPREEKPKIVGYRSIAVWPRGEVNLGDPNNESDDNHGTEEQARTVCRLLEQNGFGGNGRIFPLSTRVEPIYSAPTESTNSKLAAEIAELKRHVKDVFTINEGLLKERATLRAELEAARKERDLSKARMDTAYEQRDTALAAKDAAEKRVAFQPIETCPKDVGQCLVYLAGMITHAYLTEPVEGMMQTWRHARGPLQGTALEHWPTHWMRIPALTPAPTQEPPAGKLPIGTKIRFLKTLDAAPTGEHPYLVYANKGETGEITGHEASEGYFVKADRWPTPFGASLGDEFEAIPPAGGVTISTEKKGEQHARPETLAEETPLTTSPADVPSEGRGEWMPIETAPKDGTAILLATDQGVHRVEWIDGLWMVDDLKHGPYALRRYMKAFRWMPLPIFMLPTEGSGA